MPRSIRTLLADRSKDITVPELATALSAADAQSPQFRMQSILPSMICDHISIPLLEVLVAHGRDVNQPDRILSNTANDPGPTLLKLLCRHGDEALIDWLITHGATVKRDAVDPEDPLGYPPLLQLAAEGGRVDLFRKLLDHGAPMGPRVLHSAAACATGSETKDTDAHGQHMNMVRYLVEELALHVNALTHRLSNRSRITWGLRYAMWRFGAAARRLLAI